MNAKQLIKDAERRLLTECHKDLAHASAQELHNAVSGAAMGLSTTISIAWASWMK